MEQGARRVNFLFFSKNLKIPALNGHIFLFRDIIGMENKYQSFETLLIWQEGMQICYLIYDLLKDCRDFGLKNQMERSAVSIPSNIAEGSGRGSNPDFKRFLWHSLGSCNELEYDLQLAREVQFLPSTNHNALAAQVAEIRRMLTGLVERMEK